MSWWRDESILIRVFSISLKCIHNEAEFEVERCCFMDLLLYLPVCCTHSFQFFSLSCSPCIYLCFSLLACLYLSISPCLFVHLLDPLHLIWVHISSFRFGIWSKFLLGCFRFVWKKHECIGSKVDPEQVNVAGGFMKAHLNWNLCQQSAGIVVGTSTMF